MAEDRDDQVLRLFARFAQAVREGDLSAYRELAVVDAPLQDELFASNSVRVKEGTFNLRPRRIEREGEVCELTFDLVDAAGTVRDTGTVTLTEELDGWRIRSL